MKCTKWFVLIYLQAIFCVHCKPEKFRLLQKIEETDSLLFPKLTILVSLNDSNNLLK